MNFYLLSFHSLLRPVYVIIGGIFIFLLLTSPLEELGQVIIRISILALPSSIILYARKDSMKEKRLMTSKRIGLPEKYCSWLSYRTIALNTFGKVKEQTNEKGPYLVATIYTGEEVIINCSDEEKEIIKKHFHLSNKESKF